MKLEMFSLLDTKTGAFGTPWFQSHTAQAIRAVTDLAQDMNTTVARHPADFQLVWLGSWDDQSGQYQPQPVPVVLGTVVSFLPVKQPQLELVRGGDPVARNGAEPHPRGSVVESEG